MNAKQVTDEFKRGARNAASVAADYDSASTHLYRLGDCILGKLNLRDGKPRRNKTKVDDPKAAWLRGVAFGLAEMSRLLINAGPDKELCRIADGAGLALATARAAGVVAFDLKELRKAGVR